MEFKTEVYAKFGSETDAHEAAATFGIKKIEKKNRKKTQISGTETNVSGTETNASGLAGLVGSTVRWRLIFVGSTVRWRNRPREALGAQKQHVLGVRMLQKT